METLEQIENDIKNAKTIREYLLSKISYYDLLMWIEKQKILKLKNFDKEQSNIIIEAFNYYQNLRDEYFKMLSDFEKKGIKKYE